MCFLFLQCLENHALPGGNEGLGLHIEGWWLSSCHSRALAAPAKCPRFSLFSIFVSYHFS